MKDKPLGFQIWLIMTLFMLFVFISVSLVTVYLIEENTGVKLALSHTELPLNLTRLLASLIIFNIIFAKVLANRLTAPIRYLEKRVGYIAHKDWSKPIELHRKDEIGKLAYSISRMQESLKRLESEEEIFLQTISHDLKTPVMVIRTYCQAIKDGVYLEGSLEKTVQVLEEEAAGLEKKISSLLFLNSLEYELKQAEDGGWIDVPVMLERVAKRFLFRRDDVQIVLPKNQVRLFGLEDKLEVAIENIVDNGMRFAKSRVDIQARELFQHRGENGRFVEITVSNDGEPLAAKVLDSVFDRFFKGSQGNFGLGLYIAKRIVDYHQGDIRAENGGGTVRFRMVLPERLAH